MKSVFREALGLGHPGGDQGVNELGVRVREVDTGGGTLGESEHPRCAKAERAHQRRRILGEQLLREASGRVHPLRQAVATRVDQDEIVVGLEGARRAEPGQGVLHDSVQEHHRRPVAARAVVMLPDAVRHHGLLRPGARQHLREGPVAPYGLGGSLRVLGLWVRHGGLPFGTEYSITSRQRQAARSMHGRNGSPSAADRVFDARLLHELMQRH